MARGCICCSKYSIHFLEEKKQYGRLLNLYHIIPKCESLFKSPECNLVLIYNFTTCLEAIGRSPKRPNRTSNVISDHWGNRGNEIDLALNDWSRAPHGLVFSALFWGLCFADEAVSPGFKSWAKPRAQWNKEGKGVPSNSCLLVSAQYSREQLCPGPHVSPRENQLRTNRKKSDSSDFRKATRSPYGKWWPLQFLLRVRESLRRDPILRLCPLGGRAALMKTKTKLLSQGRRSLHLAGAQGLTVVRFCLGAWKMGRKRTFSLCLSSTWNHKHGPGELGAGWMVITSLWYFQKEIFSKPTGKHRVTNRKQWGAWSEEAIFEAPVTQAIEKKVCKQNTFTLPSACGDPGALLPHRDDGRHVTNTAWDGTVSLLIFKPP